MVELSPKVHRVQVVSGVIAALLILFLLIVYPSVTQNLLTQVTAEQMKVSNRLDPEESIRAVRIISSTFANAYRNVSPDQIEPGSRLHHIILDLVISRMPEKSPNSMAETQISGSM